MFPVTGPSLLHLLSQLLLFTIDKFVKGQFVLLQHSAWARACLPPSPLIPIVDGGQRYVVRKRYVVKHNLITEVYLMTM